MKPTGSSRKHMADSRKASIGVERRIRSCLLDVVCAIPSYVIRHAEPSDLPPLRELFLISRRAAFLLSAACLVLNLKILTNKPKAR